MNAAEARAIELEEPDWAERFQLKVELCCLPTRELCEEWAFEQTIRDYRRFHFTWLEDGKRKPLDATSAVIALAKLRIFPPRSRVRNDQRTDKLYEPDIGDDHCWLQVAGRAYRIEAIESNTLFLDSFGDKLSIDLERARWKGYVDNCVEALRAAWPA
jgi:hypothetical protein